MSDFLDVVTTCQGAADTVEFGDDWKPPFDTYTVLASEFNTRVKDKNGMTALELAESRNDEDRVRLLSELAQPQQ